ncbi:cytochrome c [Kingella sp. SNUBH-2017]|uniref:Cytochrome c n=1 Tax=Kingella pumchi TaxID=2779506 RepID=A0ABS9NNA1_9NEIS|nr:MULTISPECIES: cytochrome c [Kingella]MCG6504170.1 cytochrome c [Kingella pumchi]MDD2182255.1 cytochrome c [Kingella sp. SNUBH-2017]
MKKPILIFALSALLLAACDGGAGAGGAKGPLSEERSIAFKTFMPGFSRMGKMAKGDEAYVPEQFEKLAQTFSSEAREPFEYFASDPEGNGDALPGIWQQPQQFKAEQDKFFAAVDELNAAAKSQKLDDIRAAYAKVEESCTSCHSSYRRPK